MTVHARADSTGSYQLIRSLARGGMGQVDVVVRREGAFQRVYALKRLHEIYASDPSVRAMFVDEARIAGLIRHANVVSVLDAGEDELGPFLVMDYVEGLSLAQLLKLRAPGEPLPLAVALDIARQVARGLHAAHELRGPSGVQLEVVHRDVSPHNVLIGFDGAARVTDFGVARALDRVTQTAPGTLKGKAGYMSPEQLRYDELDRRSDLFSLGVVIFEMVANRRLYAGDRPATFRRILKEEAPSLAALRPDAPARLVELVAQLLKKHPDERPPTAAAVADAIDAILAEQSRPHDRSLARFMETELAEERETQHALVAEALSSEGARPHAAMAAQEVSMVRATGVRSRRRRGAVLALGALTLAGGVAALAIALAMSTDTGSGATEVPDPVPVADTTVEAVPVEATAIEEEPLGEAEPSEAPEAEAAPEPEPVVEAPPRRARRRPPRLRPTTPRTPTPTTPTPSTSPAPSTTPRPRAPRAGDVLGMDAFERER